MEEFFKKKEKTCILILIFIFTFSIFNFIRAYPAIKKTIQEEKAKGTTLRFTDIDSATRRLEDNINNPVVGKQLFLEGFGYLQLMMGKNEQSNFETIKDKKGFLHETYFTEGPADVTGLAENVKELKERIEDEDVKFLYVLTPDKYIRGQTEFPTGIPYNYANETADEFLKQLEEFEIDTVDLRNSIAESGMTYDELFYRTDYHWKIETSFLAYQELVGIFNEQYHMHLDEEGYYTDIDNYNIISYPDSYVGSLGRNTGKYYSGVDDFTIIYPKYKTDFEISAGNGSEYDKELSGLFEDVFISSYMLRNNGNPYDAATDKYFSYLPNNHGIYHIKNVKNPDGPKFAFIKDSMLNPVISFMSNICSDIYVIDPAFYDGDISSYLNSLKLDFVIVSYSPRNIK